MNKFKNFRIATRGLIVQNKKLLFVSDDGFYWYLPGGRLEVDESLPQCLEREIYEETGFIVEAGPIIHILECLDIADYTHKIHFFFKTKIVQENKTLTWKDEGGSVRYQQFFSLAEIKERKEIIPRFLAKGEWCTENSFMNSNANIYEGSIKTKGFEILEE